MKRREKMCRRSWMNILVVMLSLQVVLVYAQLERWSCMRSTTSDANSIVQGSNDSLYIVGAIDEGAGHEIDFGIVCLDLDGGESWHYVYDGLGGGIAENDEAMAIAFGSDGNIYAAGYSTTAGGDYDVDVISPEPGGSSARWIFETGNADQSDQFKSLVYGSDNNLYAAGYAHFGGSTDFLITKISSSGILSWPYVYDGSQGSEDEAEMIVYGGDGNIYAAGYSQETSTGMDFTVVSVDNAGNERWTYHYDGTASSVDRAYAIVYGGDGNIYAAGYSTNTATSEDFTVVSLDTDGNFRWDYTFNGTTDSADIAKALIYGSDGNLYVAGYASNTGTGTDITVTSLDPATGANRWTYTFNGTANGDDAANALVYGLDDRIYVAGFAAGNAKDFTVLSLDTTGALVWAFMKDGGGTFPVDEAKSIIYGSDGNIYTAGVFRQNRFATVSIDPLPIPDISVWPTSFYASVAPGDTAVKVLKIRNLGYGELDWSITDHVDWLSEDPASGSIGYGDSTLVNLIFDPTGFASGHYYDTLIVASNDPNNPEAEIVCHLYAQPTGIEENISYPNIDACVVASNFFNKMISINFTSSNDLPVEIILYNTLGTKVYTKTVLPTTSPTNLDDNDIAELGKGVYFLRVQRSENIYPVIKLIKF